MYIVGVTGPIGHGKTTFGEAVQKLEPKAVHYESRYIITDLALAWLQTAANMPPPNDLVAINQWVAQLVPLLKSQFDLDCTYEQLEIKETDVRMNPANYQKLFDYLARPQTDFSEANKAAFRPLLQWIGGYCVSQLDPGIWFKEILRRVEQDRQKGIDLVTVGGMRYPYEGDILHKASATVVSIHRPDMTASDLTDPTERERQNIQVDTTIINNGSLDDLDDCAKRFYADLKASKLRTEYKAVT